MLFQGQNYQLNWCCFQELLLPLTLSTQVCVKGRLFSFFFLIMFIYMYVFKCHMKTGTHRGLKKGIVAPGATVTGGLELPNVEIRN